MKKSRKPLGRTLNADIEHTLQELIDQHGIEKIYDALTPLAGKFKYSEWQCAYYLFPSPLASM